MVDEEQAPGGADDGWVPQGYVVTGVLGRGSGGPVLAALAPDGAAVALKRLPDDAAGVQGALAEADLGARLVVEGLVRTLGVETAAGGRTVLVTEQVTGGSLASVLAARARLSPGEAVTVVSPVARTLAALHGAGVVHGDVTPGNVLLDARGRPLVADLGLARLSGEAGLEAFGTPGFAAPEVVTGAPPAPATDVYSVGALAWFCLTGEPPGHPGLRADLDDLAPGVPPELAAVVHACLEPEPDRRPDAHEVALRVFDAVPPEPLRLRAGPDDTSLITRRLRASAPVVVAGAEEAPSRGATWSQQVAGVRRRVGRGRGVRLGALRQPLTPVLVGLAVVLVVALGSVWAGPALVGALGPGRAGPEATRAPEGSVDAVPVASTAGTTGPRDGAAADGGDALIDAVTWLRADPAAVVGELSEARARALGAADPRDLAAVDVPASPAMRADAAVVADLLARGQRYAGLAFRVRTAQVRSASGGVAVVRVRVDTAAYRVVAVGAPAGTEGVVEQHPATRGAPVDLHLRWDGRWRVAEVRAVADDTG